mmetsp:Transcript_7433/g.18220  ORF Transcript_7433/g.18220 Transcript_7433/m.18220 type:complete len:340 (-) Transcript_7433:253-1272(-)
MRGCARSWISHLPLMLFIAAGRLTTKRRFLLAAEALPEISRFSTGYFGNCGHRKAAFSTTPPAERKHTKIPGASCSADDVKRKEILNDDDEYSPWDNPGLAERAKTNKHAFRSRQHVNPLAQKFQQPTTLSKNWPEDVFDDLSKPIFLDIGCSRGGFLIDMASQRPDDYNYLGLEIRPIVVYHAKERVEKHGLQGGLDFVGCNANVDLERLLTLLTQSKEDKNRGDVEMVTIQFPDPHFKARHAKRRVVTPELVKTLARFMPHGSTVFLQSDVQSVLDEMRLQFREQFVYFEDSLDSVEKYIPANILGVPTEREISVLERDLPVYRAAFKRTDAVIPIN